MNITTMCPCCRGKILLSKSNVRDGDFPIISNHSTSVSKRITEEVTAEISSPVACLKD